MGQTPDESTVSDAQQRITAFWDAVSGQYDEERGNVPQAGSTQERAWISCLVGLLGSTPVDVLDVGTGTGFVANLASSAGHSATGIDLSEAMLAVARENAAARGVDAVFRLGDARAPPFAPRRFDVVINRSLIWTLLGLDRALHAWHALLRNGGRLICIYGLVAPAADDDGSSLRPAERSRGAFFDAHYPARTRRLLDGMHLTDHRPLVDAVQRAGFGAPRIETLQIDGATAPHYVLVAVA